jgi:hypothetical protein
MPQISRTLFLRSHKLHLLEVEVAVRRIENRKVGNIFTYFKFQLWYGELEKGKRETASLLSLGPSCRTVNGKQESGKHQIWEPGNS